MTTCRHQLEVVFTGAAEQNSALSDVHVTAGDLQTARFGDDTRAYHAAFTFDANGSSASRATDTVLVRSGAIVVAVIASSDGRDSSLFLGLTRTLADRMALANLALGQAAAAATPVPTLSDPDFLAAANRAADSVTLRLADLPAGWTLAPPDDNSSDVPDFTGECAPLNNGEGFPDSVVSRSSEKFEGVVADQASSSVDVFRSAAQAKITLETLADLLRRCQDQMGQMFKVVVQDVAADMSAVDVSVVELPLPSLADEAYVYRFPISFSARGVRVSFVLDFVFIRKGAMVANVITTTGDTSSSLTGDLARIIAGRMTSANATLPH